MDNYYQRKEVSNSNLTELKNYLGCKVMPNTNALSLGSLFDAMVTEPDRIDWLRKTLDGEPQSKNNWNQCFTMYKIIKRSPYYGLLTKCIMQHVTIKDRLFDWNGVEFWMPCRCKWDFYSTSFSGDLKTTMARNRQQFKATCVMFDYYRARAWYMDLENTNTDYIIGISKSNYQIFVEVVKRGDDNYLIGKQQYEDLAMKHWIINN